MTLDGSNVVLVKCSKERSRNIIMDLQQKLDAEVGIPKLCKFTNI